MHPLHQPAVIMCAHLHQEINADPELRHLRRTAAAVHILDKRPDAGPLLNQVLRTEFFLDPAHGRTADRIFLAKLVLRRQQHAGQKFPLQNLRSQVFIKFLRRCHFLSCMLPVMFHVIYYKQKTRSVNPSFRKKRKKKSEPYCGGTVRTPAPRTEEQTKGRKGKIQKTSLQAPALMNCPAQGRGIRLSSRSGKPYFDTASTAHFMPGAAARITFSSTQNAIRK